MRNLPMLLAVCALAALTACASGDKLVLPGDIARPPLSGPAPATAAPRVAVADFVSDPPQEAPGVIGRDADQVRKIFWRGDPGRTMADLVAGALSGQGVPAVRVGAGQPAPAGVPILVSGVVRRFEVNVRRRGVVSMVAEAAVDLSLSAAGEGLPPAWETTVSSSASTQDVISHPEEYRKALSTAANAAAEEGARRLRERAAAADHGGSGGGGTSR